MPHSPRASSSTSAGTPHPRHPRVRRLLRPRRRLGPILDETAKAAYRSRLAELTEDMYEAEAFSDHGRSETARREIEALTDQLTAAMGLGNRDRHAGSDTERARTAVTKALGSAITHIAAHDAVLGGHRRQAVGTGTYCSYTPGPTAPIQWKS